MTNYYKVYLTSTKGRQCVVAKNKIGVINVLNNANKEGFISYLIVKRIKGTDIPIARGNLYKECKVTYVEGLDTDWRIVGANVVDWDKYKKFKEEEER
jgi:Na+-transporting NADH:ubiquinone oxidoreductase subunit NqrF